jgi:hypothetical protein
LIEENCTVGTSNNLAELRKRKALGGNSASVSAVPPRTAPWSLLCLNQKGSPAKYPNRSTAQAYPTKILVFFKVLGKF